MTSPPSAPLSVAAAVAVGRAVTALYAARGRERERVQARRRRESRLRLYVYENWKVTCTAKAFTYFLGNETLATCQKIVLPSSNALWILCLPEVDINRQNQRFEVRGLLTIIYRKMH